MKIGTRHCIVALTAFALCGLLIAAEEKRSSAPATPPVAKAAADMALAANNFWAALTPEQQAKAGLEFKDDYRQTWHFVPSPPTPRKGLTIKEMTSAQRALAHAFLASGLSQRGYIETVTIMSLDDVLKQLEAGTKAPTRDPELYYFSIFGKPGEKDPWGWRVEGHHISMSFTIVDGKAVAAGPAFLGANPAKVLEGPRKGLRVLAVEEDMGRELVKSLTDAQRKTGILPEAAPKEIITAASRKAMLDSQAGIPYSELTQDQQRMLVDLVREYAGRLRGEIAEQDVLRITVDGWDKVKFAWAGGLEVGNPHYYRIFAPSFLIEYDNTQNNANHVHTVWRDLKNDFGEDLLAKHYQEARHDDAPPNFTHLFNGKDLTGWRGRQRDYSPYAEAKLTKEELVAKQSEWNADMARHWSVDAAKGEIVSDGKGVYLTTGKDYGDFELYVDWLMVSHNGDSGVYLRSYPQVQIWDPDNTNEVKNGAEKGSGALWNNNPDNPGKWPLVKADNPVGQWNTLRIKMIGTKVWVWLNGKQTVDGQILDNYFDRSKPVLATGPIELQTHGSEIRFRNIYIREITKGE